MLYHFFYSLSDQFGFLNVARYITFRAMIALLFSLLICFLFSPWFIRKLKTKQLGQVIRDDGPESHLSKKGTPTMGGGLIIFAVLIPALLWMDWENPYFWYTSIVFLSYGLLGFADDYLKISKKNTKGVSARLKFLFQFAIAGAISTAFYYQSGHNGLINIPFMKNTYLDLGILYIPFAMCVIVGTSNAVNLTDGLDGLAIGPVMTTVSCYAVLAYISGHSGIAEYLNFDHVPLSGELAIFCTAVLGASLGFLWYNTYPAQVFMGDVGSLPLGGAIGAIAVFSKHELLLLIIGGIFVIEALSVMTQVISFKTTGKRVFQMAPIHHHFELKGWAEPKVIVRFWIISIVLAIVGLLSLKVR